MDLKHWTTGHHGKRWNTLHEVVSARWLQAYPSDDSSCGGTDGNFEAVQFNGDWRRTVCSREDADKNTTKILVADDENDIEKKSRGCVSLATFDIGIRFSALAVDILRPVTMATSSRTNHVLVMTEIFTMYTTAVLLVSMDSADVAREVVENWELKFGAPSVLHTYQGKIVVAN